jgi:hypothetical protein
MKTDRSCLPPGSFRLYQVPLLSCNQPAAIQELYKIVLRTRIRKTELVARNIIVWYSLLFYFLSIFLENKYSIRKKVPD